MAQGTFKIPMDAKDEDKWLKFFNKSQLIVIIIVTALADGIVKFCQMLGIMPIGIFIAAILMITACIITLCKVPESSHVIGAGNNIGKVLIRMLLHRKIYSKVYIRGYGNVEEHKPTKYEQLLGRLNKEWL